MASGSHVHSSRCGNDRAALVAVGVECVASWDEVTGAMDLIAGPEGGELRMQHVADLIRDSTGSLGVVVLLVATAVMWVVALLYRYRDPEGHVATSDVRRAPARP
jgi:hypothetical protein